VLDQRDCFYFFLIRKSGFLLVFYDGSRGLTGEARTNPSEEEMLRVYAACSNDEQMEADGTGWERIIM